MNNYHNVLGAVGRMHAELGIGWRHITVSTVGIAPRIRKLARDNPQVGCERGGGGVGWDRVDVCVGADLSGGESAPGGRWETQSSHASQRSLRPLRADGRLQVGRGGRGDHCWPTAILIGTYVPTYIHVNIYISTYRYYIDQTNRRLSFEWALIANETDTAEAAHDLGKLIQGRCR